MTRMYRPDAWVLVDLTSPEGVVRKVFAGWYGGFSGSDSWKLSSEIVSVKEGAEYYEFTNLSGSVYHCHKETQRMTGYMQQVLSNWQAQAAAGDGSISIEVVDHA